MRVGIRILAASAVLASLGPGCASLRGARLYTQGSAALERGDTERAIAELERAAALLPQASEVHNHLGLAYAEAGRFAAARQAFERAIELDCANAAARTNLDALEARVGGVDP